VPASCPELYLAQWPTFSLGIRPSGWQTVECFLRSSQPKQREYFYLDNYKTNRMDSDPDLTRKKTNVRFYMPLFHIYINLDEKLQENISFYNTLRQVG
jgi:hypothetical protein